MIQRGYGRIINIGSVTSVAGYAGLAPYGASRGGIRQMTMSLADDWGKHGVTVNCLAPGWFRTAQNEVLYQDQEWVRYLEDRIPLKRAGQARDLDAAVVFLAAESSRYVTGQTLLVDGGISTGAVRALPRSKTAEAGEVSRVAVGSRPGPGIRYRYPLLSSVSHLSTFPPFTFIPGHRRWDLPQGLPPNRLSGRSGEAIIRGESRANPSDHEHQGSGGAGSLVDGHGFARHQPKRIGPAENRREGMAGDP